MEVIWLLIHGVVGVHFFVPLLLWLCSVVRKEKTLPARKESAGEADYAILVTAFQQTNQLPAVVNSLLKLNYSNYMIYVIADDCDISGLFFADPRIRVLRPPEMLASNVQSHFYAIERFEREHERLTIIDSDNLVDPDYLLHLNVFFEKGYQAVQGTRKAKNLTTSYACLDEAGDIYYRLTDRKLLFEAGSSAALSGSGMAFMTQLFKDCLTQHKMKGAGFDKRLQYEIVVRNQRIAFAEKAVVFDEKTSKTTQLVKQRSRWLNTWFRFFYLGGRLCVHSLIRPRLNGLLFSLQLLRPPLFLLFAASIVLAAFDVFFSRYLLGIWLTGWLVFFATFFQALRYFKADKRIYRSLVEVPKFVFLQLLALLKIHKANKVSIATEHFESGEEQTHG